VRRVEYDARAALAKARAAGLAGRASLFPAPLHKGLKRGAQAVGVYDLLRPGSRP
jgi:hypothetical protein